MADRGRVGNDLAPNRAIREQHLQTVRAIHESRMSKIGRGHGVVNHRLEPKFRRTRTGAKTEMLRRERADHVALENRLLIERMSRIITHSTPVWSSDPPNSAITIDHQSVLRPKRKGGKRKTTTKKLAKEKKSEEKGEEEESKFNPNDGDNLGEYNPETETNADSLQYSDDFANLHPLASSTNNLEMSRGSNALEQSAVSVTFKEPNLEESYATAPVGRPRGSKKLLPPRPNSANSKAIKIYSTMPNRVRGGVTLPRPNTAGVDSSGVMLGMGGVEDLETTRPKSAATAPLAILGGGDYEGMETAKAKLLEKRRKSMVVGSVTGLSRLRNFEKIAADNQKIIKNMDTIVAYYNKDDWEEDRRNQVSRMKRFAKFHAKKHPHAEVIKQGKKEMFAFAKDNEAKVEEWEKMMEIRLKNEALQRIGKDDAAADLIKKAKAKKKMQKTKERKKREQIEKRRRDREEAEQREKEKEDKEAQLEEVVRRELAARKGLAAAASKFNNVLVRNEAKRKQAHKELAMLATVATSEMMKTMRNNGGSSKGLGDAPGIKKMRKTLIQQHQDALIDRIVKKEKDRGDPSLHGTHQRSNTSDYLMKSLSLMDTLGSSERPGHHFVTESDREFMSASPDSKALERGGARVFDQPKLMEGKQTKIRCYVEDVVEVAGQLRFEDCTVDVEVISEEEIMASVDAGGEVGVLTFSQRVPMLIICDREAAEGYTRSFVDRLKIVRNKKRVERLGVISIKGWEDFKLEKDLSNTLI
ncbi:hypothetical protein TL16_g00911 [Triparma laevis f. inornata]|uniref:Uncharacterized protein n=1 Tax=Triparma laevis f. inornata TaxID=1714386 RepID=A0A9W7DPY9_9STRA|nr:hypothetical protein TL16_g00911 [Triparma laevis f. inornata]